MKTKKARMTLSAWELAAIERALVVLKRTEAVDPWSLDRLITRVRNTN